MKTKKTDKKLVLKKETVSILTNNDLQAANGGATLVSRCNSKCLTCEVGIIC
ncbi:MAG: class I lanthipeptide [Candidatus Aminicenantes bacterium]|nr:class I lanthipeptide [Candidatus Aminicenantes bacterium]